MQYQLSAIQNVPEPSHSSHSMRGEQYPDNNSDSSRGAGGQIASVVAENRELKAQVEQLRSERNRLMELHRRMMELMGSKAPDKIVHDLRNVLNERDLLKALVDQL